MDYLDLVVPSSKQEQADKKVDLDYLDLAISKNLNHLNVDISSPENQPTKEENGQGWGAWGKAKVAATVTAGIGLCAAALCYAAPYIPTLLNGVAALSADSERGYTNGTMCYSYKM